MNSVSFINTETSESLESVVSLHTSALPALPIKSEDNIDMLIGPSVELNSNMIPKKFESVTLTFTMCMPKKMSAQK